MDAQGQSPASDADLAEEELRLKLRSLQRWQQTTKILTYTVALVPFTLLVIFSVHEQIGAGLASGGGAFVLAAVVLFLAQNRITKLKELMGTAVTQPTLREVFDVTDYSAHGHLPGDLINSAGLIDDWSEIEGSDYMNDSYKGVYLCYSDLHLKRVEIERDHNGKKREHYVTVFKGHWLVCDFGRELAATVRLFERRGGTKWNRTHDVSRSSVETENIEFNKKFRILTDDGHSAFYLLTPHFMEQLVAADTAADCSTMFCFKDGRVHIALYSGRDFFELEGVQLDSVDNVRQKFRRDLNYLTDIVEELLKNKKLFKER